MGSSSPSRLFDRHHFLSFPAWVNLAISIIFMRNDYPSGIALHDKLGADPRNVFYVLSSTRGNSVWCSRVHDRFRFLFKCLKRSGLPMDFPLHLSSVFFVTLEYDANRFDIDSSWYSASPDLNRYLAGLRRKLGCQVLELGRVYDVHKSGICHIHLLVYTVDKMYSWLEHRNRKGKLSYRLDPVVLDLFKSSWLNGFVDVSASVSVRSGLKYISRYYTKYNSFESILDSDSASDVRKGLLFLALNSWFNKRCFAVSSKITALYTDENSGVHNSNISGESPILYPHESQFLFLGVGVKKSWLDGDLESYLYSEGLTDDFYRHIRFKRDRVNWAVNSSEFISLLSVQNSCGWSSQDSEKRSTHWADCVKIIDSTPAPIDIVDSGMIASVKNSFHDAYAVFDVDLPSEHPTNLPLLCDHACPITVARPKRHVMLRSDSIVPFSPRCTSLTIFGRSF